MQNGQPIAYASRAYRHRNLLCPIDIKKELLAIVWGIEKFHHYIYGRPVTVQCDHKLF